TGAYALARDRTGPSLPGRKSRATRLKSRTSVHTPAGAPPVERRVVCGGTDEFDDVGLGVVRDGLRTLARLRSPRGEVRQRPVTPVTAGASLTPSSDAAAFQMSLVGL